MCGRVRDVGFGCFVATPLWSLNHTNPPAALAKAAAPVVVAAQDGRNPNWRNWPQDAPYSARMRTYWTSAGRAGGDAGWRSFLAWRIG